jgi:hypothetical protein
MLLRLIVQMTARCSPTRLSAMRFTAPLNAIVMQHRSLDACLRKFANSLQSLNEPDSSTVWQGQPSQLCASKSRQTHHGIWRSWR